ncbi:keratin-associated protein 5-4 [Verticillium alfalfae VaMs.102]|uniref:Keratin-associated protein 5-4 n=1 Tax=Verticillium alfalfae (strain VaMs.102 / ATCC MYA-4576 / FGSC 10136) TaxID=526221 RepID=C9SDM8_VERA1|nr:keratin-associated protein 5-4 [Verticillium alfalfae VaMs.102]EEY17148.1 keratin-associated protein 5-4 [Verticillium alfalfae VaMs.102]
MKAFILVWLLPVLTTCQSTTSPALPPWQTGVITEDGSCGGVDSWDGMCGRSKAFCGDGCQPTFGNCDAPPPPPVTPPGPGDASPDGSCGGSNQFICTNSTFGACCSSGNWCGDSSAHCGTACQSAFGTCAGESNVSSDGKCGSNGKICLGSGFGDCCSSSGWCGGAAEHCGTGCQTAFGNCTAGSGSGGGDSGGNPGTISNDGTCAGTKGLLCKGSIYGDCCSSSGYCGSSAAHCGPGCQSSFGNCTNLGGRFDRRAPAITSLRTEPAEATGRRAKGLPLATAARPAAFVERRRTTAARAVRRMRALVLALPVTIYQRTAAAAKTARSARARPLATAAPLGASAARLRTIVVPAVKPPLAHAQRLVRTTSPLMDPAERTARPVKGPRSGTAARQVVSAVSQRITAGQAVRLFSARVRPGLAASRPMVRVGRMERRARARRLEIAARLPVSVASRQIIVVPVVSHRSAPARPVPAPCRRMEAAARTARRVRDRHLETAARRTISAESLQTTAARAARGLLGRATARPTVSPRTVPVVRGTARRALGPGSGRAAPALDIAEALEATAARAVKPGLRADASRETSPPMTAHAVLAKAASHVLVVLSITNAAVPVASAGQRAITADLVVNGILEDVTDEERLGGGSMAKARWQLECIQVNHEADTRSREYVCCASGH